MEEAQSADQKQDAKQIAEVEEDPEERHDDGSLACSDTKDHHSTRHRQWLFFVSCLYTFLFVGSFYGWGPMQLALEENGAFAWKCRDEDEATDATATDNSNATSTILCSDQSSALLNINLIAISTQILSPLLGHFVDKCGPKAGVYFMTTCLWSGLALITFATSSRTDGDDKGNATITRDRLLYLGFCLLGLVTWMGGLLTVQVGMYFNGHTRLRVILVLNTLFDGGAVVYLGLYSLTQATPKVSLTVWMAMFLGLSVLIMSASLYFWSVAVPELASPLLNDDSAIKKGATRLDETQTSGSMALADREYASSVAVEVMLSMSETKKESATDLLAAEQAFHSLEADGDTALDTNQLPASFAQQHVPVADRTHKQQLLSYPFVLLSLFASIQYGSYQWNLSTMREFLAYLGDDDYGNRYLTIFTLLLPAGVLALPLVDFIHIHLGFSGAFQCINALAFGYTLIKVVSDSLPVQIAGFVLFVVYCCMLFGTVFAFLPVLLADAVVGKATGIMFAVTGLISFLCLPLARLAVQDLGGNFLIPNIIFCALVLPSTLLAYALGRCVKREEESRRIRCEDMLAVSSRSEQEQSVIAGEVNST